MPDRDQYAQAKVVLWCIFFSIVLVLCTFACARSDSLWHNKNTADCLYPNSYYGSR